MAKISKKLTNKNPLAIVKISVSSFPAQTPPVVRPIKALIDTGANWSVITKELAEETGILDTTEMPSQYYEASAMKEGSQYAAKIAIKDFSLTTLVYVNFKPPPDAIYSMLLGCAVLWNGRFSYDGMSKPKRFALELPSGEFGLK